MEFCLIDGIQGTMQKKDLREVLKRVQQGPDQKLDKVQVLVDKLYKMSAVKDWDIQIDPEVIKTEASVLQVPEVIVQGQIIRFDPKRLFKASKPVDLNEQRWLLIYSKQNGGFAGRLFENLQKSSVESVFKSKISTRQ